MMQIENKGEVDKAQSQAVIEIKRARGKSVKVEKGFA